MFEDGEGEAGCSIEDIGEGLDKGIIEEIEDCEPDTYNEEAIKEAIVEDEREAYDNLNKSKEEN